MITDERLLSKPIRGLNSWLLLLKGSAPISLGVFFYPLNQLFYTPSLKEIGDGVLFSKWEIVVFPLATKQTQFSRLAIVKGKVYNYYSPSPGVGG